jgi:hypothetical protein
MGALLMAAAAGGLAADPLGPGLDLKGGLAVPLSPQGVNSFSQAYAPAVQPDLALTYRIDPGWLLGLELQWADYRHQSVAATDLQAWGLGLLGEWDFDPESLGAQDRLYSQLGLGAGGAQLRTDALYQSRQWTSFCMSLSFGWDRPLLDWASLLLEARAWLLVGPGSTDPISSASLSLGLRFGLPPSLGTRR